MLPLTTEPQPNEDAEEVRRVKRRLLKHLEIQAAAQGRGAPAHILAEIEELREDMGLAPRVAAPSPADMLDALETWFGEGRAAMMSLFVINSRVAELETSIDDALHDRDELWTVLQRLRVLVIICLVGVMLILLLLVVIMLRRPL